jgi:hypothetical protein
MKRNPRPVSTASMALGPANSGAVSRWLVRFSTTMGARGLLICCYTLQPLNRGIPWLPLVGHTLFAALRDMDWRLGDGKATCDSLGFDVPWVPSVVTSSTASLGNNHLQQAGTSPRLGSIKKLLHHFVGRARHTSERLPGFRWNNFDSLEVNA